MCQFCINEPEAKRHINFHKSNYEAKNGDSRHIPGKRLKARRVLQWCYSGVTVVLHTRQEVDSVGLDRCDCYLHYSGVTLCYGGVTVVLQWCYTDVTVT
jgi:hypothetical protein